MLHLLTPSLSSTLTVTHTPAMTICKAKPITPPQETESREMHTCIVEYDSTPFSVRWSGPVEYPDFTSFAPGRNDNFEAARIALGPEMRLIWRRSGLVDYGTHASIRISDDDDFPITKLAHPEDKLSLQLIGHEFNVLCTIKGAGYRTVDFDPVPVICDGAIHGYRMKKLVKLDCYELGLRWEEFEEAVQQLHDIGVCHGDLHPSNVMKDDNNELVLIDLSFAGRVGSPVPSFMPRGRFPDGIYSFDEDVAALDRMRPLW